MKQKTFGRKILLSAFILIICLSWPFWFLLKNFIDPENDENRELAAKPRLTADSYKTYPSAYEKYFNDNLPFRNYLISINTAIDYFIFHQSANTNVVTGKDNWLFYADAQDGNPIGSYQGTNLLSEEDLEAMAQNCLNIQSALNDQGKEFILFIAPNKERIYYDKMPERYGLPADTYRALQLVNYLRNHTNIRVVYPYDELMQAKESLEENIYYKTDTHWNRIGGYIGAAALMRELGIELPDIESDEITITTGSRIAGDLAGMLNLKKYLAYTDHDYIIEGYNTHNAETIEWDFQTVLIFHAEGADPRTIYVYRDSFASQMSDYIGSQFTDTYMMHKNTYSYEDFAEQNPDIFVYETAERYIDSLFTFSVQQEK